jgi:uncharacterized protein (DUF305 family)
MTSWKQGHAAAASPDAAAIRAGFEASNRKMMAGMSRDHDHQGNADLMFLTMMIPHHQGAIDMASVQLQYGKDPAMRALAQSIMSDQVAEILEMMEMIEAAGHH